MSEMRNTHIPKISVVIPTRNRSDMLSRAIGSVLEQTMKDLEVIVVDDASTQDVEAVVRSFADARLVLVRHATAKGGGGSRNTGILRARGEFVAFLDDDDEWLPEKLELQLATISSDDQPGMVYTGSFHIDQRSGHTHKVFCPGEQRDLHRHLLKQNIIGTTSTIMVRRTCFTEGVMFDEHLQSCQDWDLYLKITRHFTVACIGRPLVKYYIHDNRITRSFVDLIQGHRAILRRVISQYSCSRSVIGYHHFKIGKLALQFGDKRTGRQEILRSLSFTPWAGLNLLYLMASFLHGDLYLKGSFFFQRLKIRIANARGPLRI